MLLSRRALMGGALGLSVARTARASGPGAAGLQVGDPTPGRLVCCAWSGRPARMWAEWTLEGERGEPRRVRGGVSMPWTDHTARVVLDGVPPDRTVSVAVRFEDLRTGEASEPLFARVRSAPATRRDVRFGWSGDLTGQGWGIDPARGGYRLLERILARDLDFFAFTGDRIYADAPIAERVELPDGSMWNNRVTDAVSRVAETLDDFRGRYRYHHLDPLYTKFCSSLPVVHQWDDHEVVDNWSARGWLRDERYAVQDMATLVARGRQAWAEHTPLTPVPFDWSRLYRHVPYGPLVDLFVLDGRSYRSENNGNLAVYPRPDAQLYGRPQMAWLKRSLKRSRGLWKVILTGQPVGLVIPAWPDLTVFDGMAGGPGEPRGREHELEDLLRFLKAQRLENVVLLSGDVHFASAIHHHPDRAAFKEFQPFWEFTAGPMHGGAFGPGVTDPTFGAEIRFERGAPAGQLGIGPWSDRQFFGEVEVSGATGALNVRLFDGSGTLLNTETLLPGQPR